MNIRPILFPEEIFAVYSDYHSSLVDLTYCGREMKTVTFSVNVISEMRTVYLASG
jgi:hypothetical protein